MKVMILAAGRGERMRPLTDRTPKPLLEVGGKPLIVWHIERLAAAGFTEIVINHAHLGHKIEQALGIGAQWHVRIDYSHEKEALETAGGIATALPLLNTAAFMVINGDVWTDIDFARFASRGLASITAGKHAHLAMVDNPEHNPKGDFSLGSDGFVSSDTTNRLTFGGIGVYRSELFEGIQPGEKAKLLPYLLRAIVAKKVTGEHFSGRWIDVGTPERLQELDAELKPSRK